jgi:hypothetical protein
MQKLIEAEMSRFDGLIKLDDAKTLSCWRPIVNDAYWTRPGGIIEVDWHQSAADGWSDWYEHGSELV